MDHRLPQAGLALCIVLRADRRADVRLPQRGVRGTERDRRGRARRLRADRDLRGHRGAADQAAGAVRGSPGRQGHRASSYEHETSNGDRDVHDRRRLAPSTTTPRSRSASAGCSATPTSNLELGTEGRRSSSPGRGRARCRASTSTRRSTSSTSAAAGTSTRSSTTLDDGDATRRDGERLNADGRRARAHDLRAARPDRRPAGPGGPDRRASSATRAPWSRARRRARRRCAAIVGSGAWRWTQSPPTRLRSSEGMVELPGVLDTGTEALRLARPLLREAGRWWPRCARWRQTSRRRSRTSGRSRPTRSRRSRRSRGSRRCASSCASSSSAAPRCPGSRRRFATWCRCSPTRLRGHAGIVSFFSNMAGATAHGDSDGAWARFAIMFEPGEVIDEPTPATCYPEDDIPREHGALPQRVPGARGRGRPRAVRAGLVSEAEAVQAAAAAAGGLDGGIDNLPIRV